MSFVQLWKNTASLLFLMKFCQLSLKIIDFVKIYVLLSNFSNSSQNIPYLSKFTKQLPELHNSGQKIPKFCPKIPNLAIITQYLPKNNQFLQKIAKFCQKFPFPVKNCPLCAMKTQFFIKISNYFQKILNSSQKYLLFLKINYFPRFYFLLK